MTVTIDQILQFWFEEVEPRQWYVKDEAFDDSIRQQFEATVQLAQQSALDNWMDSATGCLALCILLDQFSRNIYRDSPQAFASDDKARTVARHALTHQFDLADGIGPLQRRFLYLPFEHHENIDSQDLCVRLATERVCDDDFTDYAERHRQIITRFGRFPHRNAVLGRENTAEELEYLSQPGAGF